jgi:hypothetical protein
VLLMLWSIGRQMVMTLWRLSAPTPRRRAAGALTGAGLIALAPLLWTLTPPTPAQLLAQALSPPATALTSAWAGARRLVDTASDRRAIPDAGRTAADAAAAGPPADDPRRSPVVLPHPGATPLQVWDFARPREPDTGPDGGENPEAGTSAGAAATRGARLELFGDGHYCIADAAAVRRCGRYRLEAGEMGGPAQPGATVLEVGDDGADATLRDGAGAVVAVRRAASPPLEPNR